MGTLQAIRRLAQKQLCCPEDAGAAAAGPFASLQAPLAKNTRVASAATDREFLQCAVRHAFTIMLDLDEVGLRYSSVIRSWVFSCHQGHGMNAWFVFLQV